MRRWIVAAAVPLLAGCAVAAGRPEPLAISRDVPRAQQPQQPALQSLALRNPGFESPPRTPNHCAERWDCNVHADPSSFRFNIFAGEAAEGKQALCIERSGKEPWATVTQVVAGDIANLRGATLRLSMMMRVTGATGDGAGPWMVLQGGAGNTLRHDQTLLKDTQGWTRAVLQFEVTPETALVEIGAVLEGPGRACLDDVRLEVVKAARRGP